MSNFKPKPLQSNGKPLLTTDLGEKMEAFILFQIIVLKIEMSLESAEHIARPSKMLKGVYY